MLSSQFSRLFSSDSFIPSSDALLPTRFLKNSNFLENFSNNFENFLSWKYNSVTWGTFSHRNSLLAESLSYTFPLWTKVFLSKSSLSRYSPPLHKIPVLSPFYPPTLLLWDLKIGRFWPFLSNLWVISHFSLDADTLQSNLNWLQDFFRSPGLLWIGNFLYFIRQLIIHFVSWG